MERFLLMRASEDENERALGAEHLRALRKTIAELPQAMDQLLKGADNLVAQFGEEFLATVSSLLEDGSDLFALFDAGIDDAKKFTKQLVSKIDAWIAKPLPSDALADFNETARLSVSFDSSLVESLRWLCALHLIEQGSSLVLPSGMFLEDFLVFGMDYQPLLLAHNAVLDYAISVQPRILPRTVRDLFGLGSGDWADEILVAILPVLLNVQANVLKLTGIGGQRMRADAFNETDACMERYRTAVDVLYVMEQDKEHYDILYKKDVSTRLRETLEAVAQRKAKAAAAFNAAGEAGWERAPRRTSVVHGAARQPSSVTRASISGSTIGGKPSMFGGA